MPPTNRKTIITLAVVFATIVMVIGIVASNEYLREQNLLLYATGSNDKAFLDATWLMSVNEVSRANRANLQKSNNPLSGLFAPPAVDRGRFGEFIQNDVTLWGVNVTITYRFFDNKLFQYLIALEGGGSLREKHSEINDSLEKRFGRSHPDPSERNDTIHSLAWESVGQRARYWMLDLSKDRTFVGVEVTYLPGLTAIEAIVKGEKQRYF